MKLRMVRVDAKGIKERTLSLRAGGCLSPAEEALCDLVDMLVDEIVKVESRVAGVAPPTFVLDEELPSSSQEGGSGGR